MIDKVEFDEIIHQMMDYTKTLLYSHHRAYIREHLRKYYKESDHKRLEKLINLCRVNLYKIAVHKDVKGWKNVFDYLYGQYILDNRYRFK